MKMKCCEVIREEDCQMKKIYEKVEKCMKIHLLYNKIRIIIILEEKDNSRVE